MGSILIKIIYNFIFKNICLILVSTLLWLQKDVPYCSIFWVVCVGLVFLFCFLFCLKCDRIHQWCHFGLEFSLMECFTVNTSSLMVLGLFRVSILFWECSAKGYISVNWSNSSKLSNVLDKGVYNTALFSFFVCQICSDSSSLISAVNLYLLFFVHFLFISLVKSL